MQKVSPEIEQLNLPIAITECFSKLSNGLERTNRNLIIEVIDELPNQTMSAGCTHDEKTFGIFIKKSEIEQAKINEIIKKDVFRALMHEAYHGILNFSEGFLKLTAKEGVKFTNEENYIATQIRTMVDDIIVNYKVSQQGFPKFGRNFLPYIEGSINLINKKQDPFRNEKERLGENACSKFKISRYIFAWAYIKYFELEEKESLLLNKFLSRFRNNFITEYEECKKITKLFDNYDIFRTKAHEIVTKKIAEMWQLSEKTEMIFLG